MNKKAPIITSTLAAGSVTSPFFFDVNITQELCKETCAESTPIFAPVFTYIGSSQLGGNEYVAQIHVEGVINYVPCNCSSCNSRSVNVSQDFTLPYYAATTPTAVSILQNGTINAMVKTPCKSCSKTFVSESSISLTITT